MDLIGGGVFFLPSFLSFPFKFVLLRLCRSRCFRVRGRIIKPVFCSRAGDVILFHALRPQTHAGGGTITVFSHPFFLI